MAGRQAPGVHERREGSERAAQCFLEVLDLLLDHLVQIGAVGPAVPPPEL